MPAEPKEWMVCSDEELEALIHSARAQGVTLFGMDTEADSLHSYREKLCLVQLAVGDSLVLVDPLPGAVSHDGLASFLEMLGEGDVWLHGADFDMTLLLRTFGYIPDRIWDTQLAARLLGESKFGLANLIEKYFAVALPKSFQKADWGKRPLPEKLVAYAYDDVRYLLPLAEQLSNKLRELGRWEWFVEWCEVSRDVVSCRKERSTEDLWRITGWGKLERKALAYLRELWCWRDEESEKRDCPSFKIMNNQQLLAMAQAAAQGMWRECEKTVRKSQLDGFRDALERAASLDPDEWPGRKLRPQPKRSEFDEAVFKDLRKRRDEVAAELGLDPTIIATRGTLEELALGQDVSAQGLMNWQRGLLFP